MKYTNEERTWSAWYCETAVEAFGELPRDFSGMSDEDLRIEVDNYIRKSEVNANANR